MVIIQEHSSSKYAPRTYFNAKSADITIALAVDLKTAGELLTHKAAGDKYIGFLLDNDIQDDTIANDIIDFIKEKKAKTINVAGNGIYTLNKYGCSQNYINRFVFNIIKKINESVKIEKIYSGGQTGVDLAGAVAANILEIPALITLPKGFIQRFQDKKDVIQSKEFIEEQINYYSRVIKNENQNRCQ